LKPCLLYRYQRLVREGEAAGDPDLHTAEVRVYADFLRIVLEILNCILTSRLTENPELVYALLHRQDVFAPFRVGAHLKHCGLFNLTDWMLWVDNAVKH
jgi:Dyggve-Melchior-Clausen syndrome protein